MAMRLHVLTLFVTQNVMFLPESQHAGKAGKRLLLGPCAESAGLGFGFTVLDDN